MIDQLAPGVLEVWTPSAVVAALVGAVVMGLVFETVAPASRTWRLVFAYVAGVGLLGVAVFWSGQTVDSILQGDANLGREIGRGLLQAVFVFTAAVSAGLARRRSQESS